MPRLPRVDFTRDDRVYFHAADGGARWRVVDCTRRDDGVLHPSRYGQLRLFAGTGARRGEWRVYALGDDELRHLSPDLLAPQLERAAPEPRPA